MGYSRKGVGGHCNGHGRGIHASLLVRLLCLSVSLPLRTLPVKLQDGSNLEIGSATNTAELQRAEAGIVEEAAVNRGESRGHPFEFGRWWGNVGHAYLRKRCWRERGV